MENTGRQECAGPCESVTTTALMLRATQGPHVPLLPTFTPQARLPGWFAVSRTVMVTVYVLAVLNVWFTTALLPVEPSPKFHAVETMPTSSVDVLVNVHDLALHIQL